MIPCHHARAGKGVGTQTWICSVALVNSVKHLQASAIVRRLVEKSCTSCFLSAAIAWSQIRHLAECFKTAQPVSQPSTHSVGCLVGVSVAALACVPRLACTYVISGLCMALSRSKLLFDCSAPMNFPVPQAFLEVGNVRVDALCWPCCRRTLRANQRSFSTSRAVCSARESTHLARVELATFSVRGCRHSR